MVVPITRDAIAGEESENPALNPLWPSVAPGTVKQTVTSSFVTKVVIAGGAVDADKLFPQNLDVPLIEGLNWNLLQNCVSRNIFNNTIYS